MEHVFQVNHSQRMSEKPLTPWVICEVWWNVNAVELEFVKSRFVLRIG